MIKQVPSLRPELELQVLPDVKTLEEREVYIAEAGTVDGISPGGSIGAQVRNCECRRIDARCSAVIVSIVSDVIMKAAMGA
jgi:hypothetical protein